MTSKGLSSLQYSESNVWDQLSVGIKHLRLRCYFLNLLGGLSLSQKKKKKTEEEAVGLTLKAHTHFKAFDF